MNLQHKPLALFWCLIILAGGCSSDKTSGNRNWVITTGSGGGVTGGSSGYSMDRKGQASSWRIVQAGGGKETTKLFELDCDSAKFYKTYLDLIRFDTISFAKTGNWTYFVELAQGEVTHRVSWAGDAGPRLVMSFYDLFTGYITSRTKH